ncbi:MAG: ABC transporter permease [Anaerolinea sp.]|nr:ABC transporter permease [Anaerolinea sp.]
MMVRRFWHIWQNRLALGLIALFVFVAAAAPLLAPQPDPANPSYFKVVSQDFRRDPEPPSDENILGTVPQITNLPMFGFIPGQDASYRWDVYFTLIWGTRSALRFGLLVTLATAVLGITLGAISGYAGGWIGGLIMRVSDAFLAFPPIAAIWLIRRLFFQQIHNPFMLPELLRPWELLLARWQIDPVMIALILFSWMPYARLLNSAISQLKTTEFAQAAKAIGATHPRILFRHLLPNALAPAIVLAARDVGGVVIMASAFIFIGIGGNVAWGVILVTSRDYVIGLGGNPFAYWWTFMPVTLALILFSIGWNLLGDGLNTMLNPRTKRRRSP